MRIMKRRASIPIYSGAHWQRGGSAGNLFGLAVRNAAPMLLEAGKKLLKTFVRKGASASIGIAKDAIRGANIQQAIRNRLGEALMSPSDQPKIAGKKRTRGKAKKRINSSKVKKQRISTPNKDIFS